MKQCIEGSHAVAELIRRCRPAVVAAYPITPQTHIVEHLSQFAADGKVSYEFVRTESEFAAASIILGASATGVRTYTATSSQGLLLMTEVLFTIAGMRLPVVLTCANRAISAPINIWNDQQDSMTVRDSGWIMLYAEDNQEVVDLHITAFKVAEQLNIPVMVNMDGFVLTHTFEPVDVPSEQEIKKYLPNYKPADGSYLDVKNPKSLGTFATPDDYMNIREDLAKDLTKSKSLIKKELKEFKKIFGRGSADLVEYYGDKNATVVFVAMGSVIGTIKEAVDEMNKAGQKVACLKIKCFRPFPSEEIIKKLSKAKYVAVIDKSVSLGNEGILATEIKSAGHKNIKAKIKSFVVGLGGRDITKEMIKGIGKKIKTGDGNLSFVK